MNAKQRIRADRPPQGSEPLFASTWVALFLVIRREWLNQ
jgi:hypothetical protein